MQDQNLGAKLKSAEAEVTDWRQKVTLIKGSISAAQAVVNASEGRRATFALGAATGDTTAAAAMKKIHSEDDAAKKQLADMNLALAPALHHLAAAEQVAGNVRRELNQIAKRVLAGERIANAGRIDEVLTKLVTLVEERDRLGNELKEHQLAMLAGHGYTSSTAVSIMENLDGVARLLAALPPAIFAKLFPTTPRGQHVALAVSEAEFWQLPVSEKNPKAA
jgi:hypothetical protein